MVWYWVGCIGGGMGLNSVGWQGGREGFVVGWAGIGWSVFVVGLEWCDVLLVWWRGWGVVGGVWCGGVWWGGVEFVGTTQ